jgi:hypothetical protein
VLSFRFLDSHWCLYRRLGLVLSSSCTLLLLLPIFLSFITGALKRRRNQSLGKKLAKKLPLMNTVCRAFAVMIGVYRKFEYENKIFISKDTRIQTMWLKIFNNFMLSTE